jgi:hypothetical protein
MALIRKTVHQSVARRAVWAGIDARNLFEWDRKLSIFRGEGAFGISVSVDRNENDGHWQLHLNSTERRPRHRPSKGSGYAPLFAKHMACGMIPFKRAEASEGKEWIKSVYVSERVLDALKRGGNITDPKDHVNPSAVEYLRRSSKFTPPWPHYGTEERGNGCINQKGQEIGYWWRAVSGIAFGGLVPQTTKELKHAVTFTISGLINVIDGDGNFHLDNVPNIVLSWAEALERLENKLHAKEKDLELFGNYVAEREDWDDASYAISCYNTGDAAAVFGRYMTLLERLTALCNEARDRETPDAKMERVFESTCDLLGENYRQALVTPTRNPEEVDSRLGNVIMKIGDSFNDDDNHISLRNCAWVAACIIAAWAGNVQIISLEPGRRADANRVAETFRTEEAVRSAEAHVSTTAEAYRFAETLTAVDTQTDQVGLEDLPSVLAFG